MPLFAQLDPEVATWIAEVAKMLGMSPDAAKLSALLLTGHVFLWRKLQKVQKAVTGHGARLSKVEGVLRESKAPRRSSSGPHPAIVGLFMLAALSAQGCVTPARSAPRAALRLSEVEVRVCEVVKVLESVCAVVDSTATESPPEAGPFGPVGGEVGRVTP